MTRDAVDGYLELGGTLVWDLDDQYGNGSVTRWSSPDSPLWGRFDHLSTRYPGTDVLWWQLCTARSEQTTLQAALAVLAEARKRLPGVVVYASAQPDYEGHVCGIAGAEGPGLMQELVKELIEMGEVLGGPAQGPLDKTETSDGCHANAVGRAKLGNQLAEFMSSLPP